MKEQILKHRRLLVILLAVILVLGAGIWFFHCQFIILSGEVYRRDAQQLDFSGKEKPDLDRLAQLQKLQNVDLRGTGLTLGEREWLQEKLPGCDVRWDVPVQGQFYDTDTRELYLEGLTAEDVIAISYLPELTLIDARNCRDYDQLAQLAQLYPDCRKIYRIELSGRKWGQASRSLKVENPDVQELLCRLPGLPETEKLLLQGKLPTPQEVGQLREAFPELEIVCQVTLGEETFLSTERKLEVKNAREKTAEEMQKQLSYFEDLDSVCFSGTKLPEKERRALVKALPQVKLQWLPVKLGNREIPQDTELLDLSGRRNSFTLEEVENVMLGLPELQKVDLCSCGFQNEDLDALNRKYEDIRVVWDVVIGGATVRTDATVFYPHTLGIGVIDDFSQKNLKYCTDLVCVDVGHSKGLSTIEWAREMKDLKYLILADTMVADLSPLENHTELKFLELFGSMVVDVSPLLTCTGLEDLNLSRQPADPDVVKQMTWLKRLWWELYEPIQEVMKNELPNTEKCLVGFNPTGYGWRQGKLYYEMRDMLGMPYFLN